jgi:hypothetical protein
MRRAEVELLLALLVDRHECDIPGTRRSRIGQVAGVQVSHPLHLDPELVSERRAEFGTDPPGPAVCGVDRHVAGPRREASRNPDAQLAGRCQLFAYGLIHRLRAHGRGGCNDDGERKRAGGEL